MELSEKECDVLISLIRDNKKRQMDRVTKRVINGQGVPKQWAIDIGKRVGVLQDLEVKIEDERKRAFEAGQN